MWGELSLMQFILIIVLFCLPILIALLCFYWIAKEAWLFFNLKNDKRLDEIIKQNKELKQEIDDLKQRIK